MVRGQVFKFLQYWKKEADFQTFCKNEKCLKYFLFLWSLLPYANEAAGLGYQKFKFVEILGKLLTFSCGDF